MPPFTAFLATLPPDPGVRPLSAEEVDALPPVPDELRAFYQTVGVGSFGGGVLFVHPPAELQAVLDLWIPPSPRRVPFARSAFGELYYHRDLRPEAAAQGMTGENPGELEDVSVVDPHFFDIRVLAFSIADFFDDVMAHEPNLDGPLRGALVRAATALHGPLRPTHQFGFVPALALGGSESLDCVSPVDLLVHHAILRQLG